MRQCEQHSQCLQDTPHSKGCGEPLCQFDGFDHKNDGYWKCKGCGQPINYFDAKKHHNICCPDNISKNMDLKEETEVEEIIIKQMEKISHEEVESYKKKGIKIKNIKSKNNNLYFNIFNIVLVLGNSGVGKTSLIQK